MEDYGGKGISEIAKELLLKVSGELPVTVIYQEHEFPLQELRKTVYTLFERMRSEGIYGSTAIINHLDSRKEYVLSPAEENALLYTVKKSNGEEIWNILETAANQMKQERITQMNLE